ncbi:MAG TPA: hypothetical protein VGY66_08050 [Gemmataceae bacterium]|jgi:hypothetical protein|nr:hypothetical protein [Gemmataceae bacterium]
MVTVSLQLSPEIEQKLRDRAAQFGKPFETFLQEIAERVAKEETAKTPPPPPMSFEEWLAKWRAWVNSQPAFPVIADDSRESIYEGCGE